MGAPGKGHWNGALLTSRGTFRKHNTFATRPDDIINNNNFYGYTVSWGTFIRGSTDIWYVLGAPRAKNLKGNVMFFAYFGGKSRIKAELSGDYGSYFGASLLVVHKTNGGDDVLIGAPTYPGKTWDEGCVYYFRNKNDGTFHSPEKFLGKSPHGRFGTVIANLGDIDLDSFPDCAISAPYEDGSVGAVYLYYGTATGFAANNHHRITPSNFAVMYPKIVIKGFGLGVSRGNDVDGNGHNEIVIGAYKSGQAFYFGTYSIIDLKGNITSSVKTLNTTSTNFHLNYCLFYTLRNKKKSSDSFVTQLLLFDERVLNDKNVTQTEIIPSDKLFCKTHSVQLKENLPKAEPLDVIYRYKKANAKDFYETNLKIPISSGCGSDNICQTYLRIRATAAETNLVIGLTNELNINVTISNLGEPAYQTKLYLTVPPEISLINLRECYFENGSYVCLVAPILSTNGYATKDFLLDVTNLHPNTRNLSIDFSSESSGQNINLDDNEANINIPVKLQNDPFIDSQSNPESAGASKTKQIIEITHSFLVGNQGPSPLNLEVVILVPQISGSKILQITTAEGVNNDNTNECAILNSTRFNSIASFNMVPPINNNSLLVSCFEPNINCVEVLCEAGFFHKSSETAIFSLNFLLYTEALAKFSGDKANAIIASNAYLNNGTNEFFATSYTVIYGLSDGSHIPLWVYVVSAVSGIVLLLILILCLYKCNFFKRDFKEKLECEQGIMEESHNEKMEEENEDDAELKSPMEP